MLRLIQIYFLALNYRLKKKIIKIIDFVEILPSKAINFEASGAGLSYYYPIILLLFILLLSYYPIG